MSGHQATLLRRTCVDCPLRFPGRYHDAETGLRYDFRRYYDPETARCISAGPLDLAPAPNHHAYVANPLRFTDPWISSAARAATTGSAPTARPTSVVEVVIRDGSIHTACPL
ncbi:RHS repeat-associated core domain-containing protein [Streptomyces sp. NBC_00151]|uniref:RHS repeat-associated core domain-containing protein n=1 Tax=Streptomyces sp. NBC_00151 TaxID=2975669 RepID=UPI002DD8FD49|nr:RHS repeat-associated core domain-containing protein [Streptomyces sp. NBC_00151]WRZ38892.1 RHS repeat-associated core domain-containing protein [Streptomyces sp. NBC_00151]